MRNRLLSPIIAAFLRALGATWRFRVEGEDPFEHGPVRIGALWHADLLIAAWYYRDRGIVPTVSLSKDGEIFAAALHRMGFRSARGSSSRGGGELLRALIRSVRAGDTIAVPLDGPRGPACEAKPGAVYVAALCDAPIQPVAFRASPAWRVKSWDRTRIPLPFARVVCRYGEPLSVKRGLDDAGVEAGCLELARRLDALGREAAVLVGDPDSATPPATSAG
jgi:lysophospholipid acyltransferase (LPLAT)-like uncharacterized protein